MIGVSAKNLKTIKSGQQLIFIDDSGDPGLKLNRMASRYFVITCVVFDDCVCAEEASATIKRLKHDLNIKQTTEFHFKSDSHKRRLQFFEGTKRINYRVRAIVVDKKHFNAPAKMDADNFYKFIIKEVLDKYKDMKTARVYLDGGGGRNYRKRTVSYFRKSLNKTGRKMSDFKFVDSETDNLIQLADMVAGAIRKKYNTNKDDYYKLFKKKIENLWEYTEN